MTQNEKISDIIDIDPDQIIEGNIENNPTPNGQRKLGVYGLSLTALLASAVAGGWFYRDVLSTYLPSDQFHAVSARLDLVESTNKNIAQKLDAVVGLTDEIKSQLGAAQAAAEDARKQTGALKIDSTDVKSKLAMLDKSLSNANASLDELKSKIASGVPNVSVGSQDVSGLTARVGRLEKELADLNNSPSGGARPQAAQLSESLASLTAKVASGAAYQDEIKLMSQLIPAAEGLDVLSSNAATGVMTKQTLAESLKEFSSKIASPTNAPEVKDDSWWGRTSNLFSGLITIKTVGEVDWKQAATQAAALVENNQTADAIKLLEKNIDVLPEALQTWRVNAAKRVSVDQALDLVNRAVSREIAARG